jgi:hypothetical protein
VTNTMAALDTLIVILYDHFFRMREKGRQVVPWLQTVYAIALEGVILSSLLWIMTYRIIARNNKMPISELPFLSAFVLLGLTYFFLIKRVYFDSGKHLKLYDEYLKFPNKKQKVLKIIVLSVFLAIPFILLFVLWLLDK